MPPGARAKTRSRQRKAERHATPRTPGDGRLLAAELSRDRVCRQVHGGGPPADHHSDVHVRPSLASRLQAVHEVGHALSHRREDAEKLPGPRLRFVRLDEAAVAELGERVEVALSQKPRELKCAGVPDFL